MARLIGLNDVTRAQLFSVGHNSLSLYSIGPWVTKSSDLGCGYSYLFINIFTTIIDKAVFHAVIFSLVRISVTLTDFQILPPF
jgi:hypothetical protein